MTTARKQLVDLNTTPYYHCVSRCVRQSFLCGVDKLSGRCYEHRKAWVEQRIYDLASMYCIDICAYAVMSNHYHLVVCINRDKAKSLDAHEVVLRWSMAHSLPDVIKKWQVGVPLDKAEQGAFDNFISRWRARLCDLSWFMKELNYDIARKANQEDECKGHFWEGRYKSQALLDESALIAAMAYADLNPVRAGVSNDPLSSEYTSIRRRVVSLANNQSQPDGLSAFRGNTIRKTDAGLPFKLIDYIELLDWSSKQFRPGKKTIKQNCPNILDRLKLREANWFNAITLLERKRSHFIGTKDNIDRRKIQLRLRRASGFCLNK